MPAPEGAPEESFSILAVCTANICRSPLVERLLRSALAEAGPPEGPRFDVASAGVRGWQGAEMNPPAAAELVRLGGDPAGFRGRDLASAHCLGADLVLTATVEHRAVVLQEYPGALRRTFTLLEFAHLVTHVDSVRVFRGSPARLVGAASAARGEARLDGYDVPDPYERSPEVYRQVADTISRAVVDISQALTGAP